MNNDKYIVIQDGQDTRYDYYTTDKYFIKKLKRCEHVNIFAEIFAWLSAICFIAFMLFLIIRCEHYIEIIIACFIGFIVFLFIGFLISFKQANMRTAVEIEFFKTDEFKKQKEQYKRQEQSRKDKELYKKASNLVKTYEILESNYLTIEEKIQKIKRYIK